MNGGGLAQTMRRTLRQLGLVTSPTKPVTEAGGRERLPLLCRKERELVGFRMKIKLCRQFRQQWNVELDARLLPPHRQLAALHMLPSHTHNVGSRVPGLK